MLQRPIIEIWQSAGGVILSFRSILIVGVSVKGIKYFANGRGQVINCIETGHRKRKRFPFDLLGGNDGINDVELK